jgi:hypothetical protein
VQDELDEWQCFYDELNERSHIQVNDVEAGTVMTSLVDEEMASMSSGWSGSK